MQNMSNSQDNQMQNFYYVMKDGTSQYPIQNQPLANVNAFTYMQTPMNPSPNMGIISNQMTVDYSSPSDDDYKKILKTNPSFVKCSNCSSLVVTKTEHSCNVASLACGCCFFGMWLIFQAVRGKDINCYDTVHRCSKCNATLNQYSAC